MTDRTTHSAAAEPKRRPVPLLDVGRGNGPLHAEIVEAIDRVCRSGRFLHGPDVEQLEKTVASISGAQYGISCASGSDALLLALMAFGIGAGDEVIVPSFTFFATASAVWRVGAKPVFADIDPKTFNLDPQAVAAAITPATKAIIPVHLFGQMADMTPILQLARKHNLAVVEDAAQAIGARYDGSGAGSLGQIGCFSFYPTKNLGGFGDGGMMTTNDESLADRLRLLAAHGMRPRYHHRAVGINSRLDTIQAAVLNVKIRKLDSWAASRAANAAAYRQAFAAAGLGDSLISPEADRRCEHVWNQFTIRIPGNARDAVRERLTALGIGTEVYYPIPLHLQECFASLGWQPGSLPHTERAAKEVLSLPVYPELTVEERQIVAEETILAVREISAQGRPASRQAA